MLYQFRILSLSPGAPYSLRSAEDVMSAWLFSLSTMEISLLLEAVSTMAQALALLLLSS